MPQSEISVLALSQEKPEKSEESKSLLENEGESRWNRGLTNLGKLFSKNAEKPLPEASENPKKDLDKDLTSQEIGEGSSKVAEYKLLLLGGSSSGKTALITRLIFQMINEESKATTGFAYLDYIVKLDDGRTMCLQLWDSPGSEFRNWIPSEAKESDALLLVFDLTDRLSFQKIVSWLHICRPVYRKPVVLVGTKADLVAQRQVSSDEAELVAKAHNAVHVSVSAANGYNILELVATIFKCLPVSAPDYSAELTGVKRLGLTYSLLNLSDREANSTRRDQNLVTAFALGVGVLAICFSYAVHLKTQKLCKDAPSIDKGWDDLKDIAEFLKLLRKHFVALVKFVTSACFKGRFLEIVSPLLYMFVLGPMALVIKARTTRLTVFVLWTWIWGLLPAHIIGVSPCCSSLTRSCSLQRAYSSHRSCSQLASESTSRSTTRQRALGKCTRMLAS